MVLLRAVRVRHLGRALKLALIAVPFDEACAYIERVHRHHLPPHAHKFSLGAMLGEELVGVVMVGRPVARHRDDGLTLEVIRLASDGTRNVCSFLYGAAARASFALGYRRLGTYIMASEPGTSLRAAGWRFVAETKGRTWDRPKRARGSPSTLENKSLFEVSL